jgi:hypothetical protein
MLNSAKAGAMCNLHFQYCPSLRHFQYCRSERSLGILFLSTLSINHLNMGNGNIFVWVIYKLSSDTTATAVTTTTLLMSSPYSSHLHSQNQNHYHHYLITRSSIGKKYWNCDPGGAGLIFGLVDISH